MLNEKSISFVTDSTLLCVGLRVSGCETMYWLSHPLGLSFMFHLIPPVAPT